MKQIHELIDGIERCLAGIRIYLEVMPESADKESVYGYFDDIRLFYVPELRRKSAFIAAGKGCGGCT